MEQFGANRADLWARKGQLEQELNNKKPVQMDFEKSKFAKQETKQVPGCSEELVESDDIKQETGNGNRVALPNNSLVNASFKTGVATKKRERTVFTEYQLSKLESAFQKEKYPDYEFKISLSKRLGLTEPKIQIWFKNRRAKLKRQIKDEKIAFENSLAASQIQHGQRYSKQVSNSRKDEHSPSRRDHTNCHSHPLLTKSISFKAEISNYPDTIKLPLITQRDHATPFQKNKINPISNVDEHAPDYYHQQQHPNFCSTTGNEIIHPFGTSASIHTHNHNHFHGGENYYGFMSPYMDLQPSNLLGADTSSVQLRMQDDSLDNLPIGGGPNNAVGSLKNGFAPKSKRFHSIVLPGEYHRGHIYPPLSGQQPLKSVSSVQQQAIINLLPYYDAPIPSQIPSSHHIHQHHYRMNRQHFIGAAASINMIQSGQNSHLTAQEDFINQKSGEFLRNSTSESTADCGSNATGAHNSQISSDEVYFPHAKRQLYDNEQDSSEAHETLKPNLNEINDMRSMCI